ncbi:MAG: alpha/beta fold hydrolase [Immundisolibacteraceae bacterium]|nr:alpha/beta fold hydrolase [Immundisolibacteraceae bacterium]
MVSKTQSKDGVELAWSAAGTTNPDQPALVFIHGFAGDMNQFTDQVEQFAPQHRVVRLDLAGHGQSGHDRAQWGVAAFADDGIAAMDAAEVDKGILIGHSMGGIVMLETANRYPDRVAGLVAIDTLQNIEALFPPGMLDQLVEGMKQAYAPTMEGFARALMIEATDPALATRLVNEFIAMKPESAIGIMSSLTSIEVLPLFEKLNLPFYAINSDMQPTNRTALEGFLSRVEVEVLEKVGHFPQLEVTERFNQALDRAIKFM